VSANNDSISKTLTVAILLCLVCSVIVAGAAVGLKDQQNLNKANDKKAAVLKAAGLYVEGSPVDEQFNQISTRIVNLEAGRFASEAELQEIRDANLTVENFDQRKSAKMPELSRTLSSEEDEASIRRLEKFAAVYLVETAKGVETIVLPVHGYGLWSTLYGFLALEGDMETIVGLGFYSHAETPGLGGEVDNPKWKALWEGKKLHDTSGDLAIEVVKGVAPQGDAHQIDGLSGATLTSRGVSNLVRFWVGDKAFGGLLKQLKGQGA